MHFHALRHLSLPLALLLAPAALAQSSHGVALPAVAPATAMASANPVVVVPSAAGGHAEAPHWGYTAPADPSVWAELSDEYKTCGVGAEQSPIDISDRDLVPSEFEPVGIHWLPFKPVFLNNGHTLQANTDGNGGYVELDGVRYDLLQFHFHAQSEHSVNGAHAPMEVHFVHRNAAGALLVLGAMIKEGDGNKDIDTLWTKIPASGDEIAIDALIDPLTLVPRDHRSYRYAGSLTTPPCSEIVTWNVYVEPVTISAYQLTAFSMQYHDNARPTQEVGRRFVLTDAGN